MLDDRAEQVIDFLQKNGECSSKDIYEGAAVSISYATLKRTLSQLVKDKLISTTGKGKATKYVISSLYEVIRPIDMNGYYEQEIDERTIKDTFNFSMMTKVFTEHAIFSALELSKLENLQKTYHKNSSQLSEMEFRKEQERLAIDLSWKSSQIEGNTYSLLETERLLKEQETGAGKTKEEASMLLNHKEAIDFMIKNPDDLTPLSISTIEDIHHILTKELSIERNVRKRRIGITGTNYKPLDNEFQIKEALQKMCDLVNDKASIFEKALLVLMLISYIQPFADGNKRTARIVSNAMLMNAQYCPISFRTVDAIHYKKAMLLFYEQNNIYNIKDIFIGQFEFAVNTYF